MRIVTTRWFHRWARDKGLTQADLVDAVSEIAHGLGSGGLGGALFKKRLAPAGRGKRGAFRVFIVKGREETYFFIYGIAKNERANVERGELDALKRLAAQLIELDEGQLQSALRQNRLIEGIHDA